jgi:hypothetical protein
MGEGFLSPLEIYGNEESECAPELALPARKVFPGNGRREELICEGYEAASPSPQWTVLPDGRHENHKERPARSAFAL